MLSQTLENLKKAVAKKDVVLPSAFTQFVESVGLQERVRSNTDCYLHVCPQPVKSPVGPGYLVRFLADSQSCLFWYLYLKSESKEDRVVASPDFYGTKQEKWSDDTPDPSEIVYCADSFEQFIGRFWLENEIWFDSTEQLPLKGVFRDYVDSYKRAQGKAARTKSP